MARKPSQVLTDAELQVMEIVWSKGKVSAKEVQDAFDKDEVPAYTTILTFLKILERKGYIDHTVDGRTYIYHPLITREDAIESDIGNVLQRFFDNSSKKLVLNLLKKEKLSDDEIKQLEEMINKSSP